jgi:uncharacterized protein (DUF885 family)
MPENRFRSDLFELADEFIEKNAELDPMTATRQGIDRYDDRLNDFSVAHTDELADLFRSTLKALDATDAGDDIDRLGKEFMTERLTTQLDILEPGELRRTFSVLWSPASEIRMVFEIQPAGTAADAARLRSRLAGVGAALASWRSALEEDSARGMTPARRHALGVADQLTTHAGGAYAAVAERLARACGVDADASGMTAAADEADKACGELAHWLRTEYASRCTETDAAGPDRYRQWAAVWNGAQLDLDEIYEWGWEDLKRINVRMWEIAAEVAPDARSLAAAAAVLDADESRAVYGTDALLEQLKALTAGAVEMLEGTHFDIDERVRFCDARLAPDGSAAAAYYVPASEDLSRPGTTWYPTLGQDRFPIWRDVSTWYHESIPGHHLQFSTSVLERERQTRYQRLEGFVSGYGEGWALYAERLMEELGAFSDPADEMGYLSGQALRAARIVVDIGMHLGRPAPADIGELGSLGDVAGRVWDAPMAVAMLEERAIVETDTATSEVDRYLGMPGQAIAYKVGERIWLRCRQEARDRLGAAFDLKAWHAYGLGLGSLGLDLFESEMAAFGSPAAR